MGLGLGSFSFKHATPNASADEGLDDSAFISFKSSLTEHCSFLLPLAITKINFDAL